VQQSRKRPEINRDKTRTISALIGADKVEEENDQALIKVADRNLQIQDLRKEPNDELPF